jgi:hypothetical protein
MICVLGVSKAKIEGGKEIYVCLTFFCLDMLSVDLGLAVG